MIWVLSICAFSVAVLVYAGWFASDPEVDENGREVNK